MAEHFDVIVIGSGAGGGTITWSLAPTGKRVLLLERGGWLPREKENWSPAAIWGDKRYRNSGSWLDGDGKEFLPKQHYYVGGNTKVYGAILFRMRELDFGPVTHVDGISPAWPLDHSDWDPWYTKAEELYCVHGERGSDPLEPATDAPYPYAPISHEPRIHQLAHDLEGAGLKPFYLPNGILINEAQPERSACVRCDTCDGFPCLVNGKADAQVICVEPALRHPNVTLRTNSRVTRLETSPDGRSVSKVVVERDGERPEVPGGSGVSPWVPGGSGVSPWVPGGSEVSPWVPGGSGVSPWVPGGSGVSPWVEEYTADVVVVSAGAINSAALLLASANEAHLNGLGNSSGVVGRHLMLHNNSSLIALSKIPNPTRFQKTLGINDFYFGDVDWDYPLGAMQMLGRSDATTIAFDVPDAEDPADLAAHSLDFWLTTEDLPLWDNRVSLDAGGRIRLHYTPTNLEAHARLNARFRSLLDAMQCQEDVLHRQTYVGGRLGISGTAHQNGTVRFGPDPATSALDLDCRMHDLDNLYVVDSSFFVSSTAVNPTLTIIANALRVGDHLAERLE